MPQKGKGPSTDTSQEKATCEKLYLFAGTQIHVMDLPVSPPGRRDKEEH